MNQPPEKSLSQRVTTCLQSRKLLFISVVLALMATSIAHAAYEPIPITSGSYNHDVVVENTAIPVLKVVTTASVDNGTNNTANTWYEIGYNIAAPDTGLPAAGSTFFATANANYSFQMAPSYTAPNGLLINGSTVTNGTFTLSTPAIYHKLSFLASGGNGGNLIGVIIRYQDGTSETNSFSSPDWFSGAIPELAYAAGGRVNSTVNLGFSNVGPDGNGNLYPRLFYRDVTLVNTTSPVVSIDLFYGGGPTNANNAILAVSGATTADGPVQPITVTGYTYDFIVEAGAPKRARVTAANGIDNATTQTMDNEANTGNTWYEKGYNINNFSGSPTPRPTHDMTGTGLPIAGSTITNAANDHVYTFAPSYTANNAVYLSPGNNTATITLATPTAFSALSFLASAGNGPVSPQIVTHHQNGISVTNRIVILDWFNSSPTFVVATGGRVAAHTAQFDVRNDANLPPRLFPVDVVLSESVSPITSIDLTYTNTGGRTAIFAVSGTTGPIAPILLSQPASRTIYAGETAIFSVTASANVPITYRWQKLTNGVFGDLFDGGNVSGAGTAELTISNASETDETDYRVVATTSAGSITSSTAILTVLVTLPDVTQPSDPIVVYQPVAGSFPAGEPPAAAINDNTGKYLNRGENSGRMDVPVGFTVTPIMGRTIVTAIRLYTANDSAGRDPANSILEGSNDGNTWTLISSNNIVLPDARNNGGLALDPLTQPMRQIRIVNTNGYTQYRWYTTLVKGNDALMQIGEVELLGVEDTTSSPFPVFTTQPNSASAYEGSSANFFVSASGDPLPSFSWMKGTDGSYVPLTDGANISGSQTPNLTINNLTFADGVDYVAVAVNSSGSVTSSVARLSVVSTLTDVTSPGDAISGFGDQSGTPPEASYWGANSNAVNAVDENPTVKWQNGGSSFNASSAFPPFLGPVGLVITPAAGVTLVTGLRVYSADGNTERDPADYKLEGSNDGSTFTLISAGSLNLPLERSSNENAFDPLIGPMQEVRFANNAGYATYRLTFQNVRINGNANSLQIGEIELLGVPSVAAPNATVSYNQNGTITLGSSMPGTLQSTTNLVDGATIWENVGPIDGTVIITPQPEEPVRFYRISVP